VSNLYAQDRESKLKDQVAHLEGQLAKLQLSVQQPTPIPNGKPKAPPTPTATIRRPMAQPATARVPSPASTVYANSRSATPVGFRASTPQEASVWDSMHAPRRHPNVGVATPPSNPRPVSRARPSFRAPSPTPSVVSNAPTLGNDGWWE
jgi:hypothetical protein